MKIKHYIYIKTKVSNKNRILMKLYKNRIPVYDVVSKGEVLYLKVLQSDYEKIKKHIVTAKFYYVNDSGIFKVKRMITPLKIFAVLFFFAAVFFFSRVIVKVEVVHSNKEIRELVKKSLDEQGIHFLSFKKDYQELQRIKTYLLQTYKDQLEWLEIESVGMKYVVRIEERILNPKIEEEKYCHIVANKSGIVSSIQHTNGEVIVHDGQYVAEGDILISGEIKYNETVKNNVCASGEVLAEVWYETSVSLPISYVNKTRTGKKRTNFAIDTASGRHKILKSRLLHYETEEKVLFHFFDWTFYKYIEYEVEEENLLYDLDAGVEKALALADEKINMKLKDGEKINTRKVLKKSINDSTIEVEIFYSVLENITKVEEFSITEVEEEGS